MSLRRRILPTILLTGAIVAPMPALAPVLRMTLASVWTDMGAPLEGALAEEQAGRWDGARGPERSLNSYFRFWVLFAGGRFGS